MVGTDPNGYENDADGSECLDGGVVRPAIRAAYCVVHSQKVAHNPLYECVREWAQTDRERERNRERKKEIDGWIEKYLVHD